MPKSCPNTMSATSSEPAMNIAVRSAARRDHSYRAVVRIAGATMIAPRMSPNHHSNHNAGNRAHCWTPAADSVVTPTVALTAVQSTAATTKNLTTSTTRLSVIVKPGLVRRAHTASTASRVLPEAIRNAVQRGASVLAFARRAPSHTAGQKRSPPSRSVASAMPVGAQTVVICSATTANPNPICAAATYAIATAAPIAASRTFWVCIRPTPGAATESRTGNIVATAHLFTMSPPFEVPVPSSAVSSGAHAETGRLA